MAHRDQTAPIPEDDPMTPALDADQRLATYGTLAPGRPNNHHLDGLEGRWMTGHVHGRLIQEGWGAELGFPALVIDPAGSAISVHVFESADLPEHWRRLDSFEGSGYQRVVITVHTPGGELEASIYAARPAGPQLPAESRSH
jgi:gamma-glutamylcyclotransferase (GGCT)/AIG2-like uncharacterized protein YtfP